MASQGFDSTVNVTSQPGDDESPYISSGTASSSAGTVQLQFSEGVKNVSASALAIFDDQVNYHDRQASPLAVSSVTCFGSGRTATACAGSDEAVDSAVLTVGGLVDGHDYTMWANQASVVPQLTDTAGNPVAWDCDATDEFDPDDCSNFLLTAGA